jgi:hypothetical protein
MNSPITYFGVWWTDTNGNQYNGGCNHRSITEAVALIDSCCSHGTPATKAEIREMVVGNTVKAFELCETEVPAKVLKAIEIPLTRYGGTDDGRNRRTEATV